MSKAASSTTATGVLGKIQAAWKEADGLSIQDFQDLNEKGDLSAKIFPLPMGLGWGLYQMPPAADSGSMRSAPPAVLEGEPMTKAKSFGSSSPKHGPPPAATHRTLEEFKSCYGRAFSAANALHMKLFGVSLSSNVPGEMQYSDFVAVFSQKEMEMIHALSSELSASMAALFHLHSRAFCFQKMPGVVKCGMVGCFSEASCGFPSQPASLCKTHEMEGMVQARASLRDKKPYCFSCPDLATWRRPDDKEPVACHAHRTGGMILCRSQSIVAKKRKACASAGCKTPARFHDPESTHSPKAFYCREHKASGMVGRSLRCGAPGGCCRPATHNFDGLRRPRLCVLHRVAGMVDLRPGRPCEAAECSATALYNYEGCSLRRFCRAHRARDMVDVQRYHKKCLVDFCKKIPTHNYPGARPALYCHSHYLPGMVRTHMHPCRQEGCPRKAQFNWPGTKPPTHCGAHRAGGMVNVYARRCRRPGCTTSANYGFPAPLAPSPAAAAAGRAPTPPPPPAQYCTKHKLPGMELTHGNRCEGRGCTKQPNFNYPGRTRKVFCADHQLPGMVMVYRRKR